MTKQEAADELQYAINLIKQDGKDWLDERDIPILEAAISALQAQEETVSRKVYEQISWERDIAVMQLKDLGYGLGEKIRTDGDTISRQAAIDAVDSETVSTNPKHFRSSEKFNKFMDDADIASFGKWKWAKGFNAALAATTIQLEKLPSAQPEQRWIPCSERLPKYGKRVLVCFKAGRKCPHDQIQVGCFGTHEVEDEWFEKIGNVTVLYTDKYYYPFDNVTAWMPLPEPYGGDTND